MHPLSSSFPASERILRLLQWILPPSADDKSNLDNDLDIDIDIDAERESEIAAEEIPHLHALVLDSLLSPKSARSIDALSPRLQRKCLVAVLHCLRVIEGIEAPFYIDSSSLEQKRRLAHRSVDEQLFATRGLRHDLLKWLMERTEGAHNEEEAVQILQLLSNSHEEPSDIRIGKYFAPQWTQVLHCAAHLKKWEMGKWKQQLQNVIQRSAMQHRAPKKCFVDIVTLMESHEVEWIGMEDVLTLPVHLPIWDHFLLHSSLMESASDQLKEEIAKEKEEAYVGRFFQTAPVLNSVKATVYRRFLEKRQTHKTALMDRRIKYQFFALGIKPILPLWKNQGGEEIHRSVMEWLCVARDWRVYVRIGDPLAQKMEFVFRNIVEVAVQRIGSETEQAVEVLSCVLDIEAEWVEETLPNIVHYLAKVVLYCVLMISC